jgi:hypothetical protein
VTAMTHLLRSPQALACILRSPNRTHPVPCICTNPHGHRNQYPLSRVAAAAEGCDAQNDREGLRSGRRASCLMAIVVVVRRWRWWPMIVRMVAVGWLHFLNGLDDGGMASAHGQHSGGDEKKNCCARGSSHPSFPHFRAVVVLGGMQAGAIALLEGIEWKTTLALSPTPVGSRNDRK